MGYEINKTPSEFNEPIKSMSDVKEFGFLTAANDKQPESAKLYDEMNESKEKKAASAISKLISSAAILAIVMALFLPSVGGVSVNAEFVSLSSTDTAIFYEIYLDGVSEQSDISIVVYNDFTRRTEKIEGLTAQGEVIGLKPNMSYTIAVMSGNNTVIKKTIRTKNAV